ncbi:stress activated map kinase interacting protein [Lasallia pustulata]|uniref:Stress activated map kinase interacting protein n=1 Tax=Lasallia pustulata TaxID=136370 RepID=A0A1W5D8R6_9LECA|nr:stress activated map kinase interacting protein [Lasallia pustulata]
MSLLQNEDFLIWQLRTSYLTHIKDGVGERLINVDSSILNNPGFRAAGWSTNGTDIKRTYSPPIPTAITSDYFQAPPRSAGLGPASFGDDEEEEGGMVTGGGTTDTVGPPSVVKRRRRREQQEDDDSSDLSDESDEDTEGAQRAAQQIRFAKMPVRTRSGSSPIRSSNLEDGPELLITLSSRRSAEGRLRRGSLGAVEAVKQRARRDTTTSSDLSSENELDPSVFRRRQINPTRAAKASNLLSEKHKEDERQMRELAETIEEDSGEESDGTTLSSEFAETGDSGSLLGDIRNPLASSSPTNGPRPMALRDTSPRKVKQPPQTLLQELPPPRPISMVQPISALGQAIRARNAKPRNPIEGFARLSGKGVLDPLNIRIYAPFSATPLKPFDMPLQRTVNEGDGEKALVTVADAIGLSLWRFHEEGLKPPIEGERLNVNRWTLRMVEDGEVDFDFPALSRTRPIVDFTSNNNRGARGRSREKPYDEFALVEATDPQFIENQQLTPKYGQNMESVEEEAENDNPLSQTHVEQPDRLSNAVSRSHAIPDQPFNAAARNTSIVPADKPTLTAQHSTPRMGASKMLKIHFTSLEAYAQTNTIEVTTDTYIAEVLDIVCKRWNLDKALHLLKVTGTNTVAPLDRTVEAIGARTDLDLVRRRFAHDGTLGLSGSPGSSSPNAPLLLTPDSPKKGKRALGFSHPLAQKQDVLGSTTNYKKYNVVRKQPMSFTPSHQRILLMDGDYMHILPGEAGKTLFDTGSKTTTVPFSMIVGCKISRRHPKTFRVVVFRERETKRYDFEAQNIGEAVEIVEEIRKGMEPYQGLLS